MYGECPACGRARVIAPRAESVTSCAAEQSDGMALPCLAAETTSYSADSRRRRTRAGASVTNSNDHSPLSLRPEPIRDTACSNQRNRTRSTWRWSPCGRSCPSPRCRTPGAVSVIGGALIMFCAAKGISARSGCIIGRAQQSLGESLLAPLESV
jgi:hypothetical protein